MSQILFDRKANDVSRIVCIKGHERQATADVISKFQNQKFYLSELLLRHEGVCLSIYGENVLAPLILNYFGKPGFEALLEQGALKFCLRKEMITYLHSEVKGVSPLQSGAHTSTVHIDPEESATVGLNMSTWSMTPKERRKLIKKVTAAYVSPSAKFAQQAAQYGHQGYMKNKFASVGMPFLEPLNELPADKRRLLCEIATECHNLAVISDLKMDSLDEFKWSQISNAEYGSLGQANIIDKNMNKLFEIEALPDFSQLLQLGAIQVKDVPKLRVSRETVKFRAWISAASAKIDSSEISREYIESITRGGFFDTTKGRVIKTLGVSGLFGAVGAGIGGLLGSVPGAMLGGTAAQVLAKVAEPGVDLGLDLIDEFFVDGLLKGWSPRHFFEKEIRPRV